MYTQCPECGTAFRITAVVLKQAAGKVRCGGCGIAFNALEYLSEQKPSAPAKPKVDEAVPELTPEPVELAPDESTKTISAEQSAALLKTLDELAGSDIRIEDTGVEWRVVDEDQESEEDGPEQQGDDETELSETGSMKWFLDESPTPVDEQLSAAPGDVDAPEIFEDADASAAAREMRFDDDTPLPEDFDFDQLPVAQEPPPVIEKRDDPSELEAAQVDLALGEPEDWEDLLGEVTEAEAASGEAGTGTGPVPEDSFEAELAAVSDDEAGEEAAELSDEDIVEEPLPGVDEQFATQAEAMGIDLSGIHATTEEAEVDDLDETSIDEDLISAAFEVEAEQRAQLEAAAQAAQEDALVPEEEDLQVEAEIAEEPEAGEADEAEAGTEPEREDAGKPTEDDSEDLEFEIDFDEADLVEARDRELVVSTEADAKLAAELGLDDDAEVPEAEHAEQIVPPMTEEEHTVNMMIDQDLLAIAVEDDEGFTSTIVQKQPSKEIKPAEVAEEEAADIAEEEAAEITKNEESIAKAVGDNPLVETIIMEGEFVRGADEEEELEEARKESGDPNLKSAAAAAVVKLAKQEKPQAKAPLDHRLVAAVAALGLLLVLQVLHQSRESLAVYPVFNSSVGAIYRVLGRPVTPSWDISGWRFEATKGSTDENDQVLTIYSRIGNKSNEALPYPLINVSLTDRFEDVIGSTVLEPGEYLAENLDTRRPVEPGNTFSALISIAAPDADATGFKLNVCYRQPGGRLRCAIDDFK